MTRKIWIISDTHFGHENIIQYCGRPFANADLMGECILDNWNSIVSDDDIIYHLGDVYLGSTPSLLFNLKGRKRLVLGNHDNGKDQVLSKVFEKVTSERKFPEFKALLTHRPVHSSGLNQSEESKSGKSRDWSYTNIHGHLHNNSSPEGDYVSACVEWHDYKPVEIEDLLTRKTR